MDKDAYKNVLIVFERNFKIIANTNEKKKLFIIYIYISIPIYGRKENE